MAIDFSDAGGPLAGLGGVGALVGLGASIFGTMEGVSAAKGEAQTSQNIAQLQIQENQQRQLAMESAARREKIENARQTQLALAKNLSSATNQGAQFGSGLAGGQAQATSAGAFQQAGINTQLGIGEKMFGLDTQIDQQKIQMAKYQSDAASAQGTSSIGQGVLGAGLNIMKMFGA
jgi:hypothetical protein